MPKFFLGLIEIKEPYRPGGVASFDEAMAAHRAFAQAVRDAGGVIESAEALQTISTATFLRQTRSSEVHAVDNPLPEVKEVFGGYYLIDVRDEQTAIELARQCPAPYGYVEVRPIWDLS